MKKLKMTATQSMTFEEGCNKYLEYCRQRNLREGTVGHYRQSYASNDIILIILWILASLSDTRYISITVCFVAFLFNDIYGFVSWQKMQKRQTNH